MKKVAMKFRTKRNIAKRVSLSREITSQQVLDCSKSIGHMERIFIKNDNFYTINSLKDIVKIKPKGDIYKGVIISSGETQLVARITGKAFSFPVVICNSDADRKIREAYAEIEQVIENK
jgi:hypothetical protein